MTDVIITIISLLNFIIHHELCTMYMIHNVFIPLSFLTAPVLRDCTLSTVTTPRVTLTDICPNIRQWQRPRVAVVTSCPVSTHPCQIHGELCRPTLSNLLLTHISLSAQPCGIPSVSHSSLRGGTRLNPGHSVTVQCDDGYKLQGSDRVTCVTDTVYTTLPQCVGKDYI